MRKGRGEEGMCGVGCGEGWISGCVGVIVIVWEEGV